MSRDKLLLMFPGWTMEQVVSAQGFEPWTY